MPEARIIHVERDPVATCWSIFKHRFTSRGNGYAYDLEDLGRYFRLYRALMAFWHQRFPGRILDVNYEHLTENQEADSRRMIAHAGLDWEDACLDFHQTRRAVMTASAAQVRRKMYRGSSEAWHNYEPWLGPLKAALADSDSEAARIVARDHDSTWLRHRNRRWALWIGGIALVAWALLTARPT